MELKRYTIDLERLRKVVAPYLESPFRRMSSARAAAWRRVCAALPASAIEMYVRDLDRLGAEPDVVAQWFAAGHDIQMTTAAIACKVDLETYQHFVQRGIFEPVLIRAMLDCGEEELSDAVVERFPVIMTRYWGLLWPGVWDVFDACDNNDTAALDTFIVSQYCGVTVRPNDARELLPFVRAYGDRRAGADESGGFPLREIKTDVSVDTSIKGVKTFAYARWRETQGLYRFDPDLARELLSTKFEAHFPVEPFFYLPERAVWIPLGPALRQTLGVPDIFAILVLPLVYDGARHLYFEFHSVTQGSFEILSNREEADFREGSAGQRPELIAIASSLGLYLATPDADLIGEPRVRETRRVKGGVKTFPPLAPQAWEVGTRLGAVFRDLRQSLASYADQGGTHRSPIPHVRVAHWHRFWYGPREGQRNLRAKWLPPIKVGFKGTAGIEPVVRRVGSN